MYYDYLKSNLCESVTDAGAHSLSINSPISRPSPPPPPQTPPHAGATSFISLYDLVSSLDARRKAEWDRLWMISDSRSDVVHPLIYNHPVTEKETLCFHLGMTDAFAVDYDVARRQADRLCNENETSAILREIHEEITRGQREKIYHHEWKPGELIISDNLAVGHEATPDTQLPVSRVGLRVLHRTTVEGTVPPAKKRN